MWDILSTEKAILDIIPNLRQRQRRRPSAEELFNAINRINKDAMVDISMFKLALDGLRERAIVFDGGKLETESFFISEEASISRTCTPERLKGVVDVDSLPSPLLYRGPDDIEAVDVINSRFDEFLSKRVKSLVCDEVRSLLSQGSASKQTLSYNNATMML